MKHFFILVLISFLGLKVVLAQTTIGGISYSETLTLSSEQTHVDITWPNEFQFSNDQYFLYVRAWYEEAINEGTTDEKTIQIENAIYNFEKLVSGFSLDLKTQGGYLTYYAVEASQAIFNQPIYHTQSFTANQGQIRFSLDNIPSEADVWLNGLLQFPGVWSIDENDIVLSSATNDGDLIDVYYKEGGSSSDTTEPTNYTVTVSEIYFNEATSGNSGTIPKASDEYAEETVVVLENDFPNSGDHFKGYTLNSDGANPTLSLSITVNQNIEVFAVYDYTETTSSSTLLNGLIGCWTMDETTGTTMSDASQNSINGSINGVTVNHPGIINTAYKFDGVDDYVELPDLDILEWESSVSIAAWIKTTTNAHWQAIIQREKLVGQGYNAFSFDSSLKLHFNESNNLGGLWSGTPITLNQWCHVVAILDGTTRKIYINGVLSANDNNGVSAKIIPDDNFHIGSTISDNSRDRFEGYMDQFLYYNRPLTDQEISELYNSGNGNAYPFDGSSGGSTTTNYTLTVTESYLNDAAANNPGSIDKVSQDYAEGTSITNEVLTTDFGDPGLNFSGFYLDDQGVTPFSDFNINENIEIFAVYDYTESTSSTLLDGLVSCWKLDEATGALVEDIHGGNDGAIAGTPVQGEPGKVGTSYYFYSESNERVDIPCVPGLCPDNFSISFWIKPANTSRTEAILKGAGGNGYNSGYAFYRWNSNIAFRWGNGSNSNGSISYDTNQTDTWHHAVASYNGFTMKLYINGELRDFDDTVNFNYESSPSRKFNLGDTDGMTNLTSHLDQVLMYNRALTDEEVLDIYNSGNGKAYPFE